MYISSIHFPWCLPSVQESDLHSAVCLEQAAHAFLRIHPPMARKYALHLILAGHRYSKSGQASLSAYCICTYMSYMHIFEVLVYIMFWRDLLWHLTNQDTCAYDVHVYAQLSSLPQRVHSARVYTQALEVYRGKGWALAEVRTHDLQSLHLFYRPTTCIWPQFEIYTCPFLAWLCTYYSVHCTSIVLLAQCTYIHFYCAHL